MSTSENTKLTLLQPEEMTDKQLRWFVKRFTGVPFFFRIHSESLPYVVGETRGGDEYVIRYQEEEDVEDYMKRNLDEFWTCYRQDANMHWSRRMLLYMVVPDWEYYAEKDYKRQYPERNGQVIDVQSYGPIGADVWSCRFEGTWRYYVAPLALLVKETWDTYAVQMTREDQPKYPTPDGIGGKGRSVVEDVWKKLGGKITEMDAAWEAALKVNLEMWELDNDLKLRDQLDKHAQKVIQYAIEKLGKEEFDKLREEHDHNFAIDVLDEDEDEEDEDEDEYDEEDTDEEDNSDEEE